MKKLFMRMLSLVLVMAMVTILIPGTLALAAREYPADVTISGTAVDFKNQPFAAYDTIFVPMEELCGYLKMEITRTGDNFTVKRGDSTATFMVGNLIFSVNGREAELSHQPILRNGVLYAGVELLSQSFGMPVAVAEDLRSVEITPNVYTIRIDEQHAAAVSAIKPDEDALVTTATGADALRDQMNNFPEKSSYVYYMANIGSFRGKVIESAFLEMNVSLKDTGAKITAVRTAPWKKGELNWNNQPELREEKSKAVGTSGSAYADVKLDILSHVNGAIAENTELSLKLLGTHRENRSHMDKVAYGVKGVNTPTPPTISITVEETYNFPVKEAVQADADDQNRYSEMGILRSLGVFTEEDEFPLDFNEGVMRWEFIRYALRLANAQIVKGSSQHFSDVPSDAPFFDEVNTARAQGYIAGDAGIAFRPYDFITLGEAITVMGRILNYDVYAEERGGYTPGYFDAARIGELYMGAATATKALSFNEMFKILRNALDAAVLEVTTYSSNGTAEYIFNENKNILTEYWNAKVTEGTVTKNEFSDLKNPAASGKENTIYIDSKELKLLYKEYNNFLGYRVKGWYDNDDRLLYMGTKEYDITEIDLADVTGDSVSGSTVNFTYKKANGKNVSDTFSVGSGKYVIYNGKSIASSDLGKILLSKADGGSIKLIGDSLTVIDAYRTMVVSTVDAENERVYDLYDSYGNTLELEDCDFYTLKDMNGVEIPLSSISKEDVISVARSLDNTLVKAIVAKRNISGKIEAIENAGSEDMVLTINGAEYETANRKTVWTSRIDVGTSGLFYIDAFGRIVGFESEKITDIPGYIITVAESGSAIRKKLQAAIMVKDVEDYVVYDFADKVEIDGKIKKKIEDIENCFKKEGTFEPQGIIFSLNADGKINKVDTYYKDTQDTDPDNKEKRETTLNKRTVLPLRSEGESKDNRYEKGNFYNRYFLTAASTLSVLNTAASATTIEDYQTLTGVLPDGHDRTTTEIYTVGNLTPNVSIAYAKGTVSQTVGEKNRLMLFDRSVIAFDEDGYEVTKIYYYDGLERKSVTARDDLSADNLSALSALNRGDIFRFGADTSGKLSAAKRIYDYKNRAFVDLVSDRMKPTSFMGDGRVHGGYTTHIEDGYLRVSQKPDASSADLDDSTTEYMWNSISKITQNGFYKFTGSSAGIEVTVATENDIRLSSHAPLTATGIVMCDTNNVLIKNIWLVDLSEMYTYSYSAGEGVTDATGIDTALHRVEKGYVISSLPAGPTRTNYDFAGWNINGEIKQPGESYTVNESVTIRATWGGYNPSIKFSFVNPDGTSICDEWWSIYKPASTEFETHKLPTQADLDGKGYNSGEKVLTGWKDNNGTPYAPGADYIPGSNGYTPESPAGETFTAEWKTVPKATFVFMDGVEEIHTYKWALEDIDGNPESHDLPTAVKENHGLHGWKDSNGEPYPPGYDYIPNDHSVGAGDTVVFTAQWYSIWSGNEPTDADKPTGDGSAANPYQISNGNQLAWFGKNAAKTANAILTDDIYLNWFDADNDGTFDEGWYETAGNVAGANNWHGYQIGVSGSGNAYTGTFNGNGKTIYGLYLSGASGENVSFFGIVGSGGTVKNTNFKGAYVVANDEKADTTNGFISVVCGYTASGTFSNLTADGKIAVANGKYVSFAGSIVCTARSATIVDCTSDVDIDLTGGGTDLCGDGNSETGSRGIGGIVGAVTKDGTLVENCTNNGSIFAPYNQKIGGVVGTVIATLTLKNCTNGSESVITHAKDWGTCKGCNLLVGFVRGTRLTEEGTNTAGGTLVPYPAE